MATKIKGLTTAEAKHSRQMHGSNELKKEKKKGFIKRFFENLSDPIIRILLIALVIQVLLTLGHINYFEVGGILSAVLISTLVSTVSEYRSEEAFKKLSEDKSGEFVNVLRDGLISKIPASEAVVGDVIYLSAGEKIHADGEMISGRISVDQSALNGESAESVKSPGRDYGWDLSSKSKVFRGSQITEGTGLMQVGRVGGETYFGMVARDVQSDTRESPLKLRLERLASQISKLGYIIAIIVGLSYLFNAVVLGNDFDLVKIRDFLSDGKGFASTFLSALTLMITVVVVAAPEGLPMMITVVLSANMKRMLNDNILVKKLVGIETAGSMNILFTDKTGTLTEGKPRLEKIITCEGSFKSLSALKKEGKIYEELLISAKYNTDVICIDNKTVGGNSTDRAIYNFFLEESAPVCQIVSKETFSSERKQSSIKLKSGK